MRHGGRRLRTVVLAGVLIGTSACSGTVSFSGSIEAPTPGGTTTNGIGPIPTVRQALPGIEAFVEKERGLKFKHPVKVKLLGSKAFVKVLDKDNKPPTRDEVNKQESVFASLGLVSPTVNLYQAFKSATDTGTIGVYNNKTKRLYVRGTQATPGVRAVMSHELTHALTDQWFGLSRPKLGKDNQELSIGFTALIEGDAERTRMAYEADVLTPAQRQVAEQEQNAAGGGGPPPGVPDVVLELIDFPYAIGPQFVDRIVADGGIAALNRAYRHPPVSSEQLLDPTAYEQHDVPKRVATPPAGGHRLEHGDLGVIGLLLTLEHGGLSADEALLTVHGWGGDQFASWQAGKRWCLRDTVVMDQPDLMTNLDNGLRDWVANRGGKAKIEHFGNNSTTFLTCS